MHARYWIFALLVALTVPSVLAQEVPTPDKKDEKTASLTKPIPLAPIKDVLYPEQPPQVPKSPYPTASNAIQAVQWMIFAKRETARALRLAQRRGDPDGVARLLVKLEDIRRHSSREATRLVKAARTPKK